MCYDQYDLNITVMELFLGNHFSNIIDQLSTLLLLLDATQYPVKQSFFTSLI